MEAGSPSKYPDNVEMNGNFNPTDNPLFSRAESNVEVDLEIPYRGGAEANLLHIPDMEMTEDTTAGNSKDQSRASILSGQGKDINSIDFDMDEYMMKRRLSTPFIKTVMAESKIQASDRFTMHAWAELQEILKSNYFVINNEFQSKEKITEELNQLVKEYNVLHLKIRENNEKIRKKLAKEEIIEEDAIKILLDTKDDGLGDATLFIKKLLYYIYERPKILATIVKNYKDVSQLKVLEETLCTTFYEDIIIDEAYDDDLLRLLAELLEVEFEKATKHGNIFQSDQFTNKMLASYLKRPECRRYVKSVLKNPVLASIRETSRIRLNPDDIQKQLDKRMKAHKSSVGTALKMTESKSAPEEMERDKRLATRSFLPPLDESEKIPVPRLKGKKMFKSGEASPGLGKILEEAKEETRTPMEMLESKSPIKNIANKDVAYILEKNFRILKKHLNILVQSVFDNLPNIPIGLRILCKIIYQLAQKKFPKLSSKEYNEILGYYLFWKWIGPNFIFPLHNGILDDFHSTEETFNNMMEIAKALQVVFTQNLYPAEDVKSHLNDYLKEIHPSVTEYYKELIAVNDDLVDQIRSGTGSSPNRIKSRAICISLHEIQVICDAIYQQRDEIIHICPEAVNLTDKIMFYSRESNIFAYRVDPVTKMRVKPQQAYVLFYELMSPSHLIVNYMEEFNKMVGFHKNLPEDQKLLLRAKHLLKNFLIGIEDIKSLIKLAIHGRITLEDILDRYQDKLYSNDSKHSSSKEKTPKHISARFLISTLKQLEKKYTENNYYELYKEIFSDFKKTTEQLDFSISTTKLQLLKALDSLKRSCKALGEVNEKKMKALKKTNVREFIKTIKIPLCITSPSTMRNLEGGSKKPQTATPTRKKTSSSTTIPEKIEITLRDEKGCIHERFAIIRELAANGGVLGGMGMSSKAPAKSTSSGSNKGSFGMGDDIFNMDNYHCDSIDSFIQIFGALAEVKEAMVTGKDRYRVNDAIIFYYNKITIGVRQKFKNITDEEFNLIMDEIENYICKRLYSKVFPPTETDADKAFYRRCKMLEWTSFEHLEIIPRNRCIEMWEYAAEVLNQIDNRLTPLEKLDCIVECFKTITQVLELASAKEGGGGADETLPIMVYVLLLASPKRIHSNINFITLLRDSEKMQAREGYCFTQVESAVMTIQSLDHRFFKMKEEEFNKLMQEKELQYGLLKK